MRHCVPIVEIKGTPNKGFHFITTILCLHHLLEEWNLFMECVVETQYFMHPHVTGLHLPHKYFTIVFNLFYFYSSALIQQFILCAFLPLVQAFYPWWWAHMLCARACAEPLLSCQNIWPHSQSQATIC